MRVVTFNLFFFNPHKTHPGKVILVHGKIIMAKYILYLFLLLINAWVFTFNRVLESSRYLEKAVETASWENDHKGNVEASVAR